LAREIGNSANVPVLHNALKRARATAHQVGLSKAQRADNVQGAFRVPAEAKANVANRRIVLIDDVLTSGATADTCARVLLRAGAKAVDVLVFARVVSPARVPI
jgi:predicted amidophosphoribosyltransferase